MSESENAVELEVAEVPTVEETAEETAEETSRVTMAEFVKQWLISHKNGTGVKGVAEATGLEASTCQTRASNYRQDQYKQRAKRDANGKQLFVGPDDANGKPTETSDKTIAVKTDRSNLKPLKEFVLDKATGNKILVRKGLNLPDMPKGGGRRNQGEYDEAQALIAAYTSGNDAEIADLFNE